jgi:aryl-alcohol dehydrogenase-like predicted oxidoreductase
MEQRQLGSLQVSAIGLGCMGMSAFYGPRDDDTSLRAMGRAVELGVTFFDTAEAYGNGTNEALIGRFLRQSAQRDHVVVATKFANARPGGERLAGSDPAVYIRQACEASLKHLGMERLDLFYQHRVDRAVPVEDTVGVMAELVREGKVGALGLSEVAPETLRRAHAVHPISAVQTEYSLWTRDPEVNGVLDTCRELGVGFVPYSPLGRGFLVGQFKSPDDLAADDGRRNHPRFQGENFQRNLKLAETVKRLAEEKGCTPAQLALAWILAQGQDLVPIPGSRHAQNIEDNAGAAEVQITGAELRLIDQVFPLDAAQGARYPDMTSVNQ